MKKECFLMIMLCVVFSLGMVCMSYATTSLASQVPEEVLFDDFNYEDREEMTEGIWQTRDNKGGPGIPGADWSSDNISIIMDPDNSQNKLLRMKVHTDGTTQGTSQTEVQSKLSKFKEGVYAARIRFYDQPDFGPDGDKIVQTFFSITPLYFNHDPMYSECDIEYLANGGWGKTGPTMFLTTWETYSIPWLPDNKSTTIDASHEGWHDVMFVVTSNSVKYYIDSNLVATHGSKYVPESYQSILANFWFIGGGLVDSSEPRSYKQDIDYIYFDKDTSLTPSAVLQKVADLRADQIAFKDTVELPPLMGTKHFFDDFKYNNQAQLMANNWVVSNGQDGDNTWDATNVSCVSNDHIKLSASNTGSVSSKKEAMIHTKDKKFKNGTYAAKMKLSDSPDVGTVDGDGIVQTFFTTSDLAYDNDPLFSSCGLDYTGNGAWDLPSTTWFTTWETYTPEPWSADKDTTHYSLNLGSSKDNMKWYTVIFTVTDNEVKYYINGDLKATHSGDVCPESFMRITFNTYFINDEMLPNSQLRQYDQYIDWVYYVEDILLTPSEVFSEVGKLRTHNYSFKDDM